MAKIYKRSRVLGKRAAKFVGRLAELRRFTSEFDSRHFERLYDSKPKTALGKKRKKAALDKVRRTHERLRRFTHRPHKLVRPTSARNLKALRDYVGVTNIKGLKAIPVPTDRAGKMRVTFDRKGRVTIKDGHSRLKVFLFPHRPRDADDVLAMTDAMVKKLPPGQYVLHTAHHFLMPTMEDRDELANMIRGFALRYKEVSFIRMLRGFKWISGSYEQAQRIKEHMATERGREKLERRRIESERKARVIAQMDRAFKSGKLPKLSARARKTGRR